MAVAARDWYLSPPDAARLYAQLFDAKFKDVLTKFKNEVFKGIGEAPSQKTALLSRTLVLAFIEACQRAMIPANFANGCRAAGLFPYD
jgi:hypothetical protein